MDADDYFAAAAPVPAAQNQAAWAGGAPQPSVSSQWGTPVRESAMPETPGRSTYLGPGKLGFFGSVRTGLRLMPVCWSAIAQQPSLLFVPLIILLICVGAVFGYTTGMGGVSELAGPNKYAAAIKTFPLLAFVMAVSVIGQAVIVVAATNTLEGHKRPLGAAWTTAGLQMPRLALFGVVYAAERTITSMLRGKRWSPGTFAANAIDRAWDFATFLTIPVMLYEDLSVFPAVKRSGKLVAARWGVQLTARAALSAAMFVVMLPVLLICLVVCVYSVPVGVFLFVVALAGMFAMSAALTGVLSAALYRFGTTGLVSPGFREADMWAVFSRA